MEGRYLKNKQRTVIGFIVLYVALYLVFMIVGEGKISAYGLNLGDNLFRICAAVIAGIWLFISYIKNEKTQKLFWLLLLFGVDFYAAAVVTEILYQNILHMTMPSPSIGGAFYGITAALMMIAMIVKVHSKERPKRTWQTLTDILIVVAVMMTLGWHFLIEPMIVQNNGNLFFALLQTCYAVAAVCLLVGMVSSLFARKTPLFSWYLWVAVVVFVVTEVTSWILTITGSAQEATWIHAGWAVGLLFAGAGGLNHSTWMMKVGKKEREMPARFANVIQNVPIVGVAVVGVLAFINAKPASALLVGLFVGSILVWMKQMLVFKQRDQLLESMKKMNEALRYAAIHNALSGLYNRRYFEEQLHKTYEKNDYPITLMIGDVDGLKVVNDTLGHDIGDKLLKTCADIIVQCAPKSAIVAHIGGDEFGVLLLHTDEKQAHHIVKSIQKKINESNQAQTKLHLSLSMGCATAQQNEDALPQVMKLADDSMYVEKMTQSKSSRNHILQSLMATLQERDYVTQGHTRRLVKYCQRMGEKLQLPADSIANLYLLAQTHDLGKVGIPDAILFKPGPLTEEEWVEMRKHSVKGYRIAVASADLLGVADLILKHHERWDGAGYPIGLAGKDIPVECRILAVVDSFDAMTNARPYKETKTIPQAVQELKRCAGTQFDPKMVKLFLEILKEDHKIDA